MVPPVGKSRSQSRKPQINATEPGMKRGMGSMHFFILSGIVKRRCLCRSGAQGIWAANADG